MSPSERPSTARLDALEGRSTSMCGRWGRVRVGTAGDLKGLARVGCSDSPYSARAHALCWEKHKFCGHGEYECADVCFVAVLRELGAYTLKWAKDRLQLERELSV